MLPPMWVYIAWLFKIATKAQMRESIIGAENQAQFNVVTSTIWYRENKNY